MSEELTKANGDAQGAMRASGTAWRSVLPGFSRWFLLFTCVIGIINVLAIQSDLSHHRQLRETTARNRTILAAKNIELSFRGIIADLNYLADSSAVRRYSDGIPGAEEELPADMFSLSVHKRWYDQVRYLDLEGKERVRVDFRGGQPKIVDQRDLQDKSGRYYFSATAQLGRGEVFVSPLDLNIERGEIEQPLKPMLRFGMPVFGADGKKNGIVLLNFLAAGLLKNFQATLAGESGELYLLNADGYWLSSPNPRDEWGFMYPQRRQLTFADRHPAVWERMLRQQAGSVQETEGHFVYSSLFPLVSKTDGQIESAPVHQGVSVGDARDYRWYIVSRYPQLRVLDIVKDSLTLSHILVSLILAAISAWFVARSLQQERMLMEHRMANVTREAQETIRMLSQAVEQSPVSVVITDPQARIEYVNRGFEAVTGYAAKEVIGKNPSILKSGESSPRLYQEMWRTISRGGSWRGEFHNKRKDGGLFWERAYISPVLDDAGTIRHYLGIKEDISLQKMQENKILHQAHYDFLTDLPNRLLAVDRLEQLIRAAAREHRQIAVLFLDLDDFKKINDTLGHEIGDRLLVEAANRLRALVRGRDTVARLGGDEFLVLLSGLEDGDAASTVAEHLLEAFRTPFLLDGRELMVTISLGVALYPQDGEGVSELLRNADVAMYHAKQEGRNTYRYFAESMNRGVVRRLALEARLRGALQRNELVLHYQPIVDLADGAAVGAEALLRWRDSELGEISPGEFIPIAEQSGLINVIGMFVLSEAARQAVRFRRQSGERFYVSVNVSPTQFHDEEFPVYVEAALQAAGLPGEALVLEITEGVLLKGDQKVGSILQRLHELNVHLSMDDFGKGYSSLSYLRRYPFDVLKIDRDFVRDIAIDPNDGELVRATLQMAHALGLKVVAEGVEQETQQTLLQEWGCDLGQGFLFGRPCAVEDFRLPAR